MNCLGPRAGRPRAQEETMKIVQTDEIPLKRGLEHRGGTFHGRIMVEGEPGALDNFQLSFGQMGGDFNSPATGTISSRSAISSKARSTTVATASSSPA
jgi:hypothetical protein